MKRFFLALILMIMIVPLSSAQYKTESEQEIMKEFLNTDIPVTSVLRSNGLVGNPDFPKAKLEFIVKRFDVDQVASSGRYYVIVRNDDGSTSRTYLEYLTANVYEGNTVFTNSRTNPTEYFIWQIDTNFNLNKIIVPVSLFSR
ncbi:MAG: hypothetical protein M0R03_16390 [Novosphingobium sp.]|nr:hypothetical protein [Novosphingobium sp.]